MSELQKVVNFFQRERIYTLVLVFIASVWLVYSRRPDAVLNPQFFAEDGIVWYANAYHHGFKCLFWPQDGYFQTFYRIVALVTQLFDMRLAPVIFNYTAIVVQVLPVLILFARRFDALIPSFAIRGLAALLYLGLPNAEELHANLAYAYWHLSLACLLVFVTYSPSTNRLQKYADIGLVSLTSISGVSVIFLAPSCLWFMWAKRSLDRLALFVPIAVGALLQVLGVFVFDPHSRFVGQYGASFYNFVTIIASQLFVAPILGDKGFRFLIESGYYVVSLKSALVCLWTILVYLSWRRAPAELKVLIMYGLLIAFVSLSAPNTGNANQVFWDNLSGPGAAPRYWYFATLALQASLIFLANQQSKHHLGTRTISSFLLILCVIGSVWNWRYKPWRNMHFNKQVAAFERSEPGTITTFRSRPPGFEMRLERRATSLRSAPDKQDGQELPQQ
ncbi:MAG: hypothetical protein K1X79_06500 [Oligoflexia bacterium]|nr:hypothetical protein [Oligoflexia bacterium]